MLAHDRSDPWNAKSRQSKGAAHCRHFSRVLQLVRKHQKDVSLVIEMNLNNIILSYLVKKVARAHGFLDPIKMVTQLARFGQPSEVMAPTELLRSGALLHARGLINSQAIQHNLDWVWPYWVERQFDPHDKAFIPRAFQLTHINLTHRNWTAVGLPDEAHTPIVDPRGLVTPFWDGWSVDLWVVDENRNNLYPSKLERVQQRETLRGDLAVITGSKLKGKELTGEVLVIESQEQVICRINVTGLSEKPAWLAVAIRPYNPEGISLIEHIKELKESPGWIVNRKEKVLLSENPDKYQISRYRNGDVANYSPEQSTGDQITCNVGMATATALFELKPDQRRQISVEVPLGKRSRTTVPGWDHAISVSSRLEIANRQHRELYDAGLRTLILHSAEEAFAGPYTYKRFWFRDAAFIVYALLCVGFKERARAVIEQFPRRQKVSGYFSSQEGEWDSNGEVLWVLQKYVELTNEDLGPGWEKIIQKATEWIIKKRLSRNDKVLHSGLMPVGFSAEHLGPNDHYYWDDFWSVAGLKAGSFFMKRYKKPDLADKFKKEALSLMACIEESVERAAEGLASKQMVPASCYRRMDSGAIGSIVVGYPLQLWDKKDPRLLGTVNYLLENCLVGGGFFHDMSHSGINPYLTLHLAQVLLRAGDLRFRGLMETIAELATSTGQWPEAIHPRTKGGCMGDGQHVWAASEWVLMLRNCFMYEERQSGSLILCSGVLPSWYEDRSRISFGPAPSLFGDVELSISFEQGKTLVLCRGKWHGKEPLIKVCLPGFEQAFIPPGSERVALTRQRETECE